MKPHTLHRLRQQFEIDRPEKDESKAVKKDRRAKVVLVQKADIAARRVNRASRREGIGVDAAAWHCGGSGIEPAVPSGTKLTISKRN